MEVILPVREMDFDFRNGKSRENVQSPRTPRRFGEFYCSAPTSPSHLSEFYRDFGGFVLDRRDKLSGTSIENEEDGHEFAFDIGEESETASLSAEELFDGGVIKPLTPRPGFMIPSAAKIDQSGAQKKAGSSSGLSKLSSRRTKHEEKRGRGTTRDPVLSSSSSRRTARSVSPIRVSEYHWEEQKQETEHEHEQEQEALTGRKNGPQSSKSSSSSICSVLTSKGSKKWRLKDFFLFRSASEGRASEKDPLRKHTLTFKKYEELKNSTFRSPDSNRGKKKSPVSAHELHYTVNRAASEDLKKKTFLPYKQGILGRFSFNPAAHALSNRFGFSHK